MAGKRNRGRKTVPIKQEVKTDEPDHGVDVIDSNIMKLDVEEETPEHTALHNRHIDKPEETVQQNDAAAGKAMLKQHIQDIMELSEAVLERDIFNDMNADHPLADVHSRITGAITRLKQARDLL